MTLTEESDDEQLATRPFNSFRSRLPWVRQDEELWYHGSRIRVERVLDRRLLGV